MPEPNKTTHQEAAAERYWQGMIARDRAARAAAPQTESTARNASVRHEAQVRDGRSEGRRARQAYTLR
jgi:hypothetical protein